MSSGYAQSNWRDISNNSLKGTAKSSLLESDLLVFGFTADCGDENYQLPKFPSD